MITNEFIKNNIMEIIGKYPIKKVILFGSRADGTNRDDSDIDLIMEFYEHVSILTLAKIKCELEELIKVSIDIVHGPIREDDMIEIGKVVELYAA